MIPVSEGQIKKAIWDFLTIGQNQGKWLRFRLNSGMFIIPATEDKPVRVIKGTEAGTSDFLVIYRVCEDTPEDSFRHNITTAIIFLEVKKSDWEPRKPDSKRKKTDTEIAQEEFQKLVESQGHRYEIVRDVDAVIRLLGG